MYHQETQIYSVFSRKVIIFFLGKFQNILIFSKMIQIFLGNFKMLKKVTKKVFECSKVILVVSI